VTATDLVALFVEPLNRLGLPYMVTGAVAAIIYGDPRLTRDIDLVVDLRASDAGRFAAAFPEPSFYVTPADVIAEEARRERRGHCNVVHIATSLKADIYLAGRDPLHAWALERRIEEVSSGIRIWLAPIEYVLLRKLEWLRDSGSEKHLTDIRAMVRVGGDRIDRAALNDWIARLDLESLRPNELR
jgi:hypothetical protein